MSDYHSESIEMTEKIDGIIEKERLMEEMYEEESWTSSEAYDDFYQQLICPSIRSYSSLDILSCSDVGEEECRLVNLNNTIKKLLELIDDPIKRGDVPSVCCLIYKFLKYNGTEGYYVKHLPQIGEILEFLSMRSKDVDEYLDLLHELLEICSRPLLLQRSSEILSCARALQRYFGLLGYLLILAPTRRGFLLAKLAIERLVEEDLGETRRDAVKPDARREAVEASRLPVTLVELTEVASSETYPDILEMILALVSASRVCCFRILEAGIENQLLLRMHPSYGCGFESLPVTDDTNLQLDKEDYHKSLEYSTKILLRALTSVILSSELPESMRNLTPPSQASMWSLRAALRREAVRGRRSARSRKLRNELANLILANLTLRASGRGAWGSRWELAESGIAEDLANLLVATESSGGSGSGAWAEAAAKCVETDGRTGLAFKKTMLLVVGLMVGEQPDVVPVLKNKRIISGILQLINLNFETAKMPWNSEQLWHLFKYASNALTYLAPKIPVEFIEDSGSLKLLLLLERFMKVNFDVVLIMCLTETICSLSSANCDSILNDFRKYEFVPVMLQLVDRILNFETLSRTIQKIITFLLITNENIIENQKYLQECNCTFIVKIAVDLLQRCVYQKPEDSELEQSFIVGIGTFIWKCLTDHSNALKNFLVTGGLYLLLDLVKSSKLPVQNFYLGLLTDMCENEFCRHYLFSWRCSGTGKGFISLLANIWREEERIFDVERTLEGCIKNIESPMMNDEQWIYLYYTKSSCNSSTTITTAIGPARPKIYYLRKLIMCGADSHDTNSYEALFNELPLEDQITMLAIDAYDDLKADEASREISALLDLAKLQPLLHPSAFRSPTVLSTRTLRVRDAQGKLLELRRAEEIRAEHAEFQGIRDSRLNPAFDALRELGFVGRTSRRDCMLAKTGALRTKEAVARAELEPRDAPLYPTYNFGANVTTIFNQHLKVRSISRPCMNSTKDEVSMVSFSTSTLSPSISLSSLATSKSDSSFLLNGYKFDANGNIRLKS